MTDIFKIFNDTMKAYNENPGKLIPLAAKYGIKLKSKGGTKKPVTTSDVDKFVAGKKAAADSKVDDFINSVKGK